MGNSVLFDEDTSVPEPESSAENNAPNGGNGRGDVFADFIAQQIEALLREKTRLAEENQMLEHENSQLHELLCSNLEATHLDAGGLHSDSPNATEDGASEAADGASSEAAASASGSRLHRPSSSGASSAGGSSSWTTCSDADYLEVSAETTVIDHPEAGPSSQASKDGQEAELEAATMDSVAAEPVANDLSSAAAVIDDVPVKLSCSLPMEPSTPDISAANGEEPVEPDSDELDDSSISRRLDFGEGSDFPPEPADIHSTTSSALLEDISRVHLGEGRGVLFPCSVPTWGRMRDEDEYPEDTDSEVSSEDDGLAFWEDSQLGALPPIVENAAAEEFAINDEDPITAAVEPEAEFINIQQHADDSALEMPSPSKTAMVWVQNPEFEDQMALPSRTADLGPATPEQRSPIREGTYARMCRLSPECRVLWKSPLSPAQILARHPVWEAPVSPFDEAWNLPLRGTLSRPDEALARNKQPKAGFMKGLRRVLVAAAGGGFAIGIAIGLASAGEHL